MTQAASHKPITEFKPHRVSAFSGKLGFARRMVLKRLAQISRGCLRVHESGNVHTFGEEDGQTDLVADIYVQDMRVYTDVMFSGSIGSAEAYMSDYWSTPCLRSVIQIFVRNIDALDAMDTSQSLVSRIMLGLYSRFSRNTHTGAKRNISAHYDLGNDFFSLFLDKSMMYSSAIYPHPEASLEEAATYKLQVICERLCLNDTDHLLEIGTGWGGLALYAASHYGCRVTTTTISEEQYKHAQQIVKDAGLEHLITVKCNDYRELEGSYSKLVSVEMIEAVGHEYYAEYFKVCSRLLTTDGLMLLQAITIVDQRYDMARKQTDFIQRYIFPGGGLPSATHILQLLTRHTQLNLVHFQEIGQDYARTLNAWRKRFMAELGAVREQGFDDRFIRMWEFYLCYCEGGFRERSIGTGQFLLAGPDYRPSTQV
ncbi:MAG TPA: cyclopropane-fatty-acyl-phospholipid synthase family protein [Cellvibrionaceae bacterium]